jgi:hypothetical protein
MPKCVAPKCANVKDRCQCPNPWVEYLSHVAAERVTAGLPRLSLKDHVRGYRSAVKSGLFKPQESRKPVCKSDSMLLCDWRLKRGHKSISRARHPPAHATTPHVPLIRKWPIDLLTLKSDLLHHFAQTTLKADYQGVPLAFKCFTLEDDHDRRSFMWQTQMHFELYKRMPSIVPRLMKAYFLKSGKKLTGVQIMERVPGVPLAQVLERAKNNPSMMTRLAEHLSNIFRQMQRHRVWHGDLHCDNIIVKLGADGRILHMFVIDFGETVLDIPIDAHNLYRFVRDFELQYWVPYLRKAGVHVAADIHEWDDHRFDAETYVQLHDKIVGDMKVDPSINLEIVTTG